MSKIVLTSDTARRLVSTGTVSRSSSIQRVSSPTERMDDRVRLARLASAWTKITSSEWRKVGGAWTAIPIEIYRATAVFIVAGQAETGSPFYVYAPTATEKPAGVVGTTRFYVVWQDCRWEAILGGGGGGDEPEELDVGTAVTNVTATTSAFVTGVSGVVTGATGTFVSSISVDSSGRMVFTKTNVATTSGSATVTTSSAVVSITKTTGDFYKP